MKSLDDLKQEIGKNGGFDVPNDYFENFSQNLMTKIPESTPLFNRPRTTLFEKMKPSLYMAAMFAAIILTLKLFIPKGSSSDTTQTEVFTSYDMLLTPDVEVYQDYYNDYSLTNYELSSMDQYSQVESFVHFAGL
ncbi:MAG: hypothetical protein ACRCTF_04810 [Bacteroidales bacterium]